MMGGAVGRVLLVAIREYKQQAKSKGFWLTMIIVPFIMAAAGYLPQYFQENKPIRGFAVVDQSGGAILNAIDEAIALDTGKRVLAALKDYADDNIAPERVPMLSPLAPARGELTSDDVAAFESWGGLEKAREILPGLVRDGAKPFVPPRPRFQRVALPAEIGLASTPAEIGAALGPYLRGDQAVSDKPPYYLSSAIIVPQDYALTRPTSAIQYWTVNINDYDLETLVERALTTGAKRAMYQEQGMSPETVAAIEARRVALQGFSPDKQDNGGEVSVQDRLLNIVPLGLAVMLWMSIFTVAPLLLHGVIEERSNRLVEVLLSSVSAQEFMAGKLIGIAGIGLTILSVWLTAGLVILSNGSGPAAQFAASAISLVLSGPYIPAFIFYFFTGYLTISSVFLGLGSISNSLQEAQSLLTPLIFILMAPFFLLLPMMEDPNGALATTVGWIPIYTPFVMMVRLSTNPDWQEVLATGALTLAFTALVVWGMARLFRSAVLRTGQPPRFVEIWRMIAGRAG